MAFAATATPGVETQGATHADLGGIAHNTELCNKIMRKRQDEMSRRTKLLDPRTRMYGVNHKVLDDQIAEKQAAAHADAEEERYHTEAQLLQDQVLAAVEHEKQASVRARQQETIDYSLTHLRRENRREFALSDPNQLKNSGPPRDEELGPSSFVLFPSTLVDNAAKKKVDQYNQREFLLGQWKEKEAREQDERDIDWKFAQEELKSNQIRQHIQYMEEEEAKLEKREEAAENRSMAEVQYQKRMSKLEREVNDKAKHCENLMNDPRMQEALCWEVSPNVPGKLINYKRLTPEEQQDVLNMNAQLVLDKMLAKDTALEEEAAEARRVKTQTSVQTSLEDRRQHLLMAQRNSMVEHNKKMAQDKAARDSQERRAHKSFDIIP